MCACVCVVLIWKRFHFRNVNPIDLNYFINLIWLIHWNSKQFWGWKMNILWIKYSCQMTIYKSVIQYTYSIYLDNGIFWERILCYLNQWYFILGIWSNGNNFDFMCYLNHLNCFTTSIKNTVKLWIITHAFLIQI